MVEQLIRNEQVAGSSPVNGSRHYQIETVYGLSLLCLCLLLSRKTYGFTLLGRRLKRKSRDFFFARLLRGSPLPYHTANGKTVAAVIVTLRENIRRVRRQVVTVCSRTSSSRPPVAISDAPVDVTIRAIVEARTEKVEDSGYSINYTRR